MNSRKVGVNVSVSLNTVNSFELVKNHTTTVPTVFILMVTKNKTID